MKVLYIVCMILGMMVMLLAARLIFLHRAVAVSYTHLTLPTILRV